MGLNGRFLQNLARAKHWKIQVFTSNPQWPTPPLRNFVERVFDLFIIIFLLTVFWVSEELGKINDMIFRPMVWF